MRRECLERFPRHRLQRKPLVIDPGMHHGTCVTHVPWCMSGSLSRGGGENVPVIPGACTTCNFTYLARGPWRNNPYIFLYILGIWKWLYDGKLLYWYSLILMVHSGVSKWSNIFQQVTSSHSFLFNSKATKKDGMQFEFTEILNAMFYNIFRFAKYAWHGSEGWSIHKVPSKTIWQTYDIYSSHTSQISNQL